MNRSESVRRALPALLAGAGMALSQTALGGGCTLPGSGRCSACGGCLLVLAGLTGWALWNRKHGVEDDA